MKNKSIVVAVIAFLCSPIIAKACSMDLQQKSGQLDKSHAAIC
jgi:hypothetical protein